MNIQIFLAGLTDLLYVVTVESRDECRFSKLQLILPFPICDWKRQMYSMYFLKPGIPLLNLSNSPYNISELCHRSKYASEIKSLCFGSMLM